MVDRLEVSVDIDLTSLTAQLNKAEEQIRASWNKMEEDLKLKPTVDTVWVKNSLDALNSEYSKSQSKRVTSNKTANAKITSDTIAAHWRQVKSIKNLSDLSEKELDDLKARAITNLKQIDAAFRIDPNKNTAAMKKREADIRKVWIVAKDTGKKLDEAAINRYIEIWISKEKTIADLNEIKHRIALETSWVIIDIDVQKEKIKAELKQIKAGIDTVTWVKTTEIDLVRQQELMLKLKALDVQKRTVTKAATVKITADTEQYKKELTLAKAKMLNLETSGKETTSRLWTHFKNLATSIKGRLWVAAVIAWITMAVRWLFRWMSETKDIALSWESAFTWVKKTTKATAKEFRALKSELIELTKEIPSTFEELSKIAELGWQMWVPIDQLKVFTRAVANIATTTNLSIEQAATQFSRLHNILQEPLSSIEATASAVVDLGNNFAAQEDEILNFTLRIAGSWKVVWMTAADLAGMSTALTSVWIKAEMWGTAMSKAMLKMNWAVVEGKEALDWFAKVSWLSAEEFKKLWKNDSASAFTKFVEWLWAAGDSADSIISKLLWNNVRTKQAFLNLAWAWDLLAEAIKRWNKAYEEKIALSTEATLRYGTEESKLKILANQYARQQEIIWKKLLPIYVSLAKAKVSLTKWITKLSEVLGWMDKVMIILWWSIWTIIALILWFMWPLWWVIWWVTLLVWWVTAALVALWNAGEQTKTKIEELGIVLWDLISKISDTQIKMEELESKFLDWKLSLDEYRLAMNKLIAEEKDLQKEKEKTIKNLAAANELQNALKDDEKIRKEQFGKEKAALEQYNKALDEQKDKLKGLSIQKKKNIEDWMDMWEALKIEKEWIAAIDDWLKKYKETLDQTKIETEEVTKKLDDQSRAHALLAQTNWSSNKQMEVMNSLQLNADPTVEEIAKVKTILEEVSQAAINEQTDILNTLKASAEWLRNSIKMVESVAKISRVFIGKKASNWLGWVISDWMKDDLADVEASIESTASILKNASEKKYNPLAFVSDEWTILWDTKDKLNSVSTAISKITDTSKEAAAKLKEINSLINEWNISSETMNALLEAQATTTEDLIKLKKKELSWIWPSWWTKTTLDAEAALIKANYLKRISYVNDFYYSEIKKSEALLLAKKDYELQIQELEWKTHESLISQAESLIKKRDELKEEGQDTYNWIWDSIQDAWESLAELAEEIKEVNDEIANIDSEAINDLKERYAEIVDEITWVNIKIWELEAGISAASEETSTLDEERKAVSSEIKDSQKLIDWYQKSIEKINSDMASTDTSTSEKLAAIYVKLSEEILTSQTRLDELNAKASLSTVEAEEKLKLEQEITAAVIEQSLARWEVTNEEVDRATLLAGETDTERLIRERDEKNALYAQELSDLETKLADEQAIIATAQANEATLRTQLDSVEEAEQVAKLEKMTQQLEDYYAERASLIEEKSLAENQLSNSELQSALDKEGKTKTDAIIKQRAEDLDAKAIELQDLKDSNAAKIEELREYYMQMLKLQQLSKRQFWEGFSFDDFSSEDYQKNLSWADTGSLDADFKKDYEAEMEAQKEATDKLGVLSDALNGLIKRSKLDSDQLLKFLKVTTWLRQTANLAPIIDRQSQNTVTQSNVFSITNGLDIASIESMLRRSLKI